MVNLLPLGDGERVTAVLPLGRTPRSICLHGDAPWCHQKSLLENLRARSVGLIAVNLIGDELVEVGLTDGQSDILIVVLQEGDSVSEKQVRPMGRSARGVRSLNLKLDQSVIAMLIRKPNGKDSKVLVATENGYGKQTSFSDFPLKNRGGRVMPSRLTAATGALSERKKSPMGMN